MSAKPTLDPTELGADRVRPVGGATGPRIAPPPIELSAQDARALPVVVTARPLAPPPRKWLGRIFGWSLGLFVAGVLVLDAWNAVQAAFARSTTLGSLLGAALAAAVVSGGAIFLREVIGFEREANRLREVSTVAVRAAALATSEDYGHALPLAHELVHPYRNRPATLARIEQFQRVVSTAHSDQQIIELLAEIVVRPLDAEAYQVVVRAARDSAVGVALVPFGLLDAAIAAWRALRMVREVAGVYGFRPSFLGRVALLRRVFAVAATAGVSDFVGDALLAHAGAKIAGMVSARVGEGLLTGLRVARLGAVTMSVCRPLPFAEADKPALSRLGTEVLKALPGMAPKA